ncbi:MAG: hypothetical protein KKI08_16535 [Armatimonadetes bacterium]|nr:hypothetical protein [Armatimonadota bacterium]
MPAPQWIQQVRERVDVAELAEAVGLGVEVDVYHARPHYRQPRRRERIAACPKCGAEGRGAARVLRPQSAKPGRGYPFWRCYKCGTTSGNLDLVAYVLAGDRLGDLDNESRRTIRAWFAAQGWCDDDRREAVE